MARPPRALASYSLALFTVGFLPPVPLMRTDSLVLLCVFLVGMALGGILWVALFLAAP